MRTFIPFVAGIARMHWARFQLFNFIGSIAWVGIIIYLGYFFGNTPVMQENFSLIVIVIIVISLIPPLIGYIKHRRTK
jgi:membrane-associated protein